VELLCYAFQIYFVIMLVRVIFSWVQAFGGRLPDAVEPVYRLVHTLTEPVLTPFRKVIPPVGMFDLSFLVCIIVLQAAASVICAEG
jgi:YggT family protein